MRIPRNSLTFHRLQAQSWKWSADESLMKVTVSPVNRDYFTWLRSVQQFHSVSSAWLWTRPVSWIHFFFLSPLQEQQNVFSKTFLRIEASGSPPGPFSHSPGALVYITWSSSAAVVCTVVTRVKRFSFPGSFFSRCFWALRGVLSTPFLLCL